MDAESMAMHSDILNAMGCMDVLYILARSHLLAVLISISILEMTPVMDPLMTRTTTVASLQCELNSAAALGIFMGDWRRRN